MMTDEEAVDAARSCEPRPPPFRHKALPKPRQIPLPVTLLRKPVY
jgi:hypothetical protein